MASWSLGAAAGIFGTLCCVRPSGTSGISGSAVTREVVESAQTDPIADSHADESPEVAAEFAQHMMFESGVSVETTRPSFLTSGWPSYRGGHAVGNQGTLTPLAAMSQFGVRSERAAGVGSFESMSPPIVESEFKSPSITPDLQLPSPPSQRELLRDILSGFETT